MVGFCVSLWIGLLKDSWFWLLDNSQRPLKALYKQFLSEMA